MMLRIIEVVIVAAIVVYGFIKLLEMFSGFNLQRKKGTALDELAKQAEEVAKNKKDISDQTQKATETIEDINNKLNN